MITRKQTRRRSALTLPLTLLCFLMTNRSTITTTTAFMPTALTLSTRQQQHQSPTQISIGAGAATMDASRPAFGERMRNLALGRERKTNPTTAQKKKNLPPNVKVVLTLEEYKQVVGNEKDRIVCVRFFATWCKVSFILYFF